MKDIAIYGAGGFGREVACLIESINQKEHCWNFIGYFDDNQCYKGKVIDYGKVLGDIDVLNGWTSSLSVVLAIGAPQVLKFLSLKITNQLISFPNIISPDISYLDDSNFIIGNGNIICTHCMISTNVTIGNFNIINGYIPIGHDVSLGSYNVVMPSVNISGAVTIGDSNFLGVSSVVLQGVKIGNDVRIGAGSVVIRNTKNNYLYMGNPALRVKL